MTATTTRRLALIGMGRMGRVLAELAPERGWQVVARIDSSGNDRGRGITAESLAGADVAIEFTAPRATVANVKAAVVARCPIVVGTTGWNDALPALAAGVGEHDGALASRLLATAPGFDAHLVETHHAAKKDAPSGTALTLARAGSQSWHGDIPISSVRTGNVPGTHELIFDAPFETIHLTHTARDRRVFAEGALVAAGWLIGRHGVYTMRDVLDTHVEAVGA